MMQRQRRRAVAEINVVPYIDVMLVLLVIFMITAPMLTQGVKVELPTATTEPLDVEKSPPLIVSIDKEGHYFLNNENQQNEAISLNNLLVSLLAEVKIATQQHTTRQVLVRGDKNVPYGRVIHLMAVLKNAGLSQVGLMTSPPSNQGTQA